MGGDANAWCDSDLNAISARGHAQFSADSQRQVWRRPFSLARKSLADHLCCMTKSARLTTRRTMLAEAAVTLAAMSAPAWLRGQQPGGTRRIAVTIDDGPASGVAGDLAAYGRIANALRETFVAEKVPAIMFVNERQLNVKGQRDARVAVLEQWIDAGLDVGNHTYSHPNLNEMTLSRYFDDIIKGEVISRSLLEARNRPLVWFRYPFLASGKGEIAEAVEAFLAVRGYRIAPVSVDYADYRFAGFYSQHLRAGDQQKADAQLATMLETLDAAFARAEKSSMEVLGYELPQTLLIHCNEMNALTLRTSIQRMRDRGYAFISLDQAMQDPAYQVAGIRPGGMGGGGFFGALEAAKRGSSPAR
jgi:peptidoglycan/xylan/chitin deacetylase (PgdA/CDA1 family)